MKYILEVYSNNECIASKEYEEPFIVPNVEEEVYIEPKNNSYSKNPGNWWIVETKKYLFLNTQSNIQKVQLYCRPCSQSNGSAEWIRNV
jgi:hypothetical protein